MITIQDNGITHKAEITDLTFDETIECLKLGSAIMSMAQKGSVISGISQVTLGESSAIQVLFKKKPEQETVT